MKVMFIRHAETTYEQVKLRNMNYDLGSLTDLGIEQAKSTSLDERLKDAEIIISSPYTRTMHTAGIINAKLGLELLVEEDLREWTPDINFKDITNEIAKENYNLFMDNMGKRVDDKNYETREGILKRVNLVLEKYSKIYKKVIFVTHGIVIKQFFEVDGMVKNCEILEYEYK